MKYIFIVTWLLLKQTAIECPNSKHYYTNELGIVAMSQNSVLCIDSKMIPQRKEFDSRDSAFAFMKTLQTKDSAEIDSLPKCDSGLVYFPNMSTSSLRIHGGCVTQAQADTLWKEFAENLCGETSFCLISFNDKDGSGLSHDSQNTWNDKTGCTNVETWQKRVKWKWIKISKDEYERLNKNQ